MNVVKTFFIIILFNFFSQESFCQLRFTKEKGEYYYFDRYDFLLPKDSINTSLLYLWWAKMDVEKLNIGGRYHGVYQYASFNVNKKSKLINVKLFDDDKVFKKVEVYNFSSNTIQKNDTLFYNLGGMTEIKSWNIIATNLKTN